SRLGAGRPVRAGALCSGCGVVAGRDGRRPPRSLPPRGGDPMSRRARSLRLHAISSALLAAIVAAFAVSPARAQAPKQVVPFEGTQVFRQLLSHAKLKPLAGSADLDNTDPKDVIVIYLGAMASGRVDRFDHGLKEFVDKGGAVLVASEHWDFGALNRFGITLNPNRIVDNNDRYAENRECP